jgi:hypothetical protein
MAPSRPDQPEEAPFEVGVGEEEGVPVEATTHDRQTWDPRHPLEPLAQPRRVDQVEHISLVDRRLELMRREPRGYVDDGEGGWR